MRVFIDAIVRIGVESILKVTVISVFIFCFLPSLSIYHIYRLVRKDMTNPSTLNSSFDFFSYLIITFMCQKRKLEKKIITNFNRANITPQQALADCSHENVSLS